MSPRSRIKMRHLEAFAEVVRSGGVSKAARALCITQSAVSRSLSELEDILGAPLMARETHGGVPTQYGEVFFRYAEQTLALLREGRNAVATARERGGFKIVCGTLPNIAARILPLAIGDFMRKNPGVLVEVIPGLNAPQLTRLKTGELEFVVGRLALPKEMEGVSFEHLYSERLALAVRAGHPLLEMDGDARDILKAIDAYPYAHLPRNTSARADLDDLFIRHNAPLPSRRVDTESVGFARKMTMEKDAVWGFPLAALEDDLRAGTLKELPLDMTGTFRAVGVSVRAGARLSPQCAELINQIREYAEKIRD